MMKRILYLLFLVFSSSSSSFSSSSSGIVLGLVNGNIQDETCHSENKNQDLDLEKEEEEEEEDWEDLEQDNNDTQVDSRKLPIVFEYKGENPTIITVKWLQRITDKDGTNVGTIKPETALHLSSFVGHSFLLESNVFKDGSQRITVDRNKDEIVIHDDGQIKLKKREIKTTSQAMAVKFRNLSNKKLHEYYVAANGKKTFQGVFEPGKEATTNSYIGHVFELIDPSDQNKIVARFVMRNETRLYAYIDPETADPEDLARHNEEVKFNEEYYNRTGRHWLAYYPKGPAKTFIWPADYIGQKHTVSTPHGLMHSMEDEPTKRGNTTTFTLEVVCTEPRVFIIKNFFSDEEAEHLVAQGKDKLRRSSVGSANENGQYGMQTDTRTSTNTWINRHTSAMTENLYRRVADILKVDEKDIDTGGAAEDIQLVQYEIGQEYAPHHDWGVERTPATRFVTLLLYLNDKVDPEAGGDTQFPHAKVGKPDGLTVHPGKGNAVIFYSQLPDGNVDDLSLHAALPVRRGVKNLANFWIWDKEYGNTNTRAKARQDLHSRQKKIQQE